MLAEVQHAAREMIADERAAGLLQSRQQLAEILEGGARPDAGAGHGDRIERLRERLAGLGEEHELIALRDGEHGQVLRGEGVPDLLLHRPPAGPLRDGDQRGLPDTVRFEQACGCGTGDRAGAELREQ